MNTNSKFSLMGALLMASGVRSYNFYPESMHTSLYKHGKPIKPIASRGQTAEQAEWNRKVEEKKAAKLARKGK